MLCRLSYSVTACYWFVWWSNQNQTHPLAKRRFLESAAEPLLLKLSFRLNSIQCGARILANAQCWDGTSLVLGSKAQKFNFSLNKANQKSQSRLENLETSGLQIFKAFYMLYISWLARACSGLLGLAWAGWGLLGLAWAGWGLLGLAWARLGSSGLTWVRLSSLGFACARMCFLRFAWAGSR